MNKPIIIERFADNGEHSHWELVDDNRYILWSESHPMWVLMDNVIRRNLFQEKSVNQFIILSEKINKFFELFDKTYGPCLAYALKKGYVIPTNDLLQVEAQLAEITRMGKEIAETNKYK